MLNRSSSPHVDLETIRNLINAGEAQATEHLVKVASLYGTAEIHDEMIRDHLVIPELLPLYRGYINPPQRQGDGAEALRYIASRFTDTAGEVIIDDPQTRSAIMFLVWGTPYGEVTDANRWRPVIERWILESPEATPISNLCTAQCPDQPGNCAITMMSLLGGYFELIRFDSPLESLIPQDRFLDSERASTMVLRSAAQRRADHGGELLSLDRIAQQGSCLVEAIAAPPELRSLQSLTGSLGFPAAARYPASVIGRARDPGKPFKAPGQEDGPIRCQPDTQPVKPVNGIAPTMFQRFPEEDAGSCPGRRAAGKTRVWRQRTRCFRNRFPRRSGSPSLSLQKAR